MAVAFKDRKRLTPELKGWLDDVAAYDREFKKWDGRVERIIKRYRDERASNGEDGARFNILHSNVQTLIPATFSRLPQPDVSRRFRDNDPVGRVASLILERALDFEIQHYPDYKATMRESVLDRFLGGRGTAWVRYEPHFKAADAGQITEDIDDSGEQLDYECAPTDYVHWKDFGHSVARTWEEVTRVWRIVYMTSDAVEKRFGDKAEAIPMDASPQEIMSSPDYKPGDPLERAKIYEGWDKDEKTAVWFSKAVKDLIDEKDDPLGLEGFFPCPKPLYATLTNDKLIPVPDYVLYQDQAKSLDTLAERIQGLIEALKVMGTYDASVPELSRLFTEGANGTLVPVKNWAAFVEKNGLQGAISLVDLKPIAEALKAAYEAFQQVIGFIYQVTGISDVIRGQTDPDETLGAQELKGQFASLRLKDIQNAVAEYATGLLQLKAQVYCLKFSPETLAKMASVEQLTPEDRQFIPQALALLVGEDRMMNPEAEGKNPLRAFRIEVNADTLVQFDENAEKQNAVEFLTAVGGYMKQAAEVGMAAPQLIPLILELLKFGVSKFKVGKSIEGTIDQAIDDLKKQIANGPQSLPPQMQEQLQMQQEALQKGAQEVQKKGEELQTQEKDLFQRETQLQVDKIQHDASKQVFAGEQKMAVDRQKMNEQSMADKQTLAQEQMSVNTERDSLKLAREKDAADYAKKDAEKQGQEVEAKKTDSAVHDQRMEQAVAAVIQSNQDVTKAVAQLAKVMAADKVLEVGPDGKKRVRIAA